SLFSRFRAGYGWALARVTRGRWLLVPADLIAAVLAIWLVGGSLGRGGFPTRAAGQIQVRPAPPRATSPGPNGERAHQPLEAIKAMVGPDKVDISLGYVGVVPPSYPINSVYLWMGGPEEAVLRVALKRGSGIRVEELKHRLRAELPKRLGGWLRREWEAKG